LNFVRTSKETGETGKPLIKFDKTDGWKKTLPANVGWRSNPPFLPAFFWAAGGFQSF
jgi:hypothetical protein